jgi:hypothetical protein
MTSPNGPWEGVQMNETVSTVGGHKDFDTGINCSVVLFSTCAVFKDRYVKGSGGSRNRKWGWQLNSKDYLGLLWVRMSTVHF